MKQSKMDKRRRLIVALIYLICVLVYLLGLIIAITQGGHKMTTKKKKEDHLFVSRSDIVVKDIWGTSLETPRYLIIPEAVKIDLNTGEVRIEKGVTLTEASERFWKSVSEAFVKLENENKKLRQRIKNLEREKNEGGGRVEKGKK